MKAFYGLAFAVAPWRLNWRAFGYKSCLEIDGIKGDRWIRERPTPVLQ